MRCLAVGDVHGCYDALVALALYVPFKPEDRVITLGDYVNRGPDSRAVLDWLIASGSAGSLVPLRGNHEIMMLQARQSQEAFDCWMECGGDATLACYSERQDARGLADIPDAHWQFIEHETRAWYESDRHFRPRERASRLSAG